MGKLGVQMGAWQEVVETEGEQRVRPVIESTPLEDKTNLELTILMPCLNEERTLAECIEKAYASLQQLAIEGEVVVADNGSSDRSREIALNYGARVISVAERGYGAALKAGIEAARGRYVIMGDADCSYDFSAIGPFVAELARGNDLVCGNRFVGGIEPDAMPFLHRYLGNPVLSFLGKLFHGSNLGDFHCGLRGFHRERMLALGLQCPGMEFASEMIVKAARAGLRIAEVPTKLYPDKRDRKPHLNTWRDGWRHLRFLLLFSPKWLFLIPGLVLLLSGVAASASLFALGGVNLGGIGFGVHTGAYALCAALVGSMMVQLSLGARKIGAKLGLFRLNKLEHWVLRVFGPEKGLLFGGVVAAFGGWIAWLGFAEWTDSGFSQMNPEQLMQLVLPSVFFVLVGIQLIVGSFFNGLLDLYFSYIDKK